MSFAGSVIESIGGYLGAREQRKGAESAARTSANAANYATDVQRQMFEQARADQEPWRNYGSNALNELGFRLGVLPTIAPTDTAGAAIQAQQRRQPGYGSLLRSFQPTNLAADPGYQFRLAEGTKALERGAAARGGLFSGAQGKALNRFGQGLASDEFANAYNRYNQDQSNIFNRLSGLSGTGQATAQQVGAQGQNYANALTNISQANAANQGNAALAGANARASGYGALGYGIGNALSRPNQGGGGAFSWLPSGTPGLGSGYYANVDSMFNGYEPFDYAGANALGGYYD